MNKIFKKQIGKTIEVYIHDRIVKSSELADHLKNLAETIYLLQ